MSLENEPRYSQGIYYVPSLRGLALVNQEGKRQYLLKNNPPNHVRRLIPLEENPLILLNMRVIKEARDVVRELKLEDLLSQYLSEIQFH